MSGRDDVGDVREALVQHQLECAEKATSVALNLMRLKHAVIALVVLNIADTAGVVDFIKALLI